MTQPKKKKDENNAYFVGVTNRKVSQLFEDLGLFLYRAEFYKLMCCTDR